MEMEKVTKYIIGANNEYKTKDLHEASFLYAKGKKLLRLEGGDREFWFVFEDLESCEILSNSYWSREATIVAKELIDSIRTLKDMIFSKK